MNEAERMFPIQMGRREWESHPDCPRGIPWRLVAPHEARALRNHDQDLMTLARRGGLDPVEMQSVLLDCPILWFKASVRDETLRAAIQYLKEIVA
jgi:hypothetical protein